MGPILAIRPTVREKLFLLLERELGAKNLDESTTLEAMGIDSLEFVSLMQCIGHEIKFIPESKYHALNTVGDLLEALI